MKWLVAFLFTQAVEVPVYLLAYRLSGERREGLARRFAAAFGASALTHPIVWFVLPHLAAPLGYRGYVAVAEVFAVVAEALYLRALGLRWALAWTLLANVASASLGLFLRSRFGWP